MNGTELEKIINKYSKLLWSVSSKVLDGVGNEQDVEECVADVFIDLWRYPESFDPARGSLKTWLSIKCRSKSIDRFRRLTAHATDELSPEQVSDMLGPAEEIVRKESVRRLRELISALEDPAKEIMIRRFWLEQKPAEISDALNLPVRKVENIIFRTKQKLKSELGGTI